MSSQDVKSGEENVLWLPQVKQMDRVNLTDGPGNLEAPSSSISYALSSLEDSDFKDRIAFQDNAFIEETKQLEALADIYRLGQEFVNTLYTYRSCAKAIPMVQQDTSEEVRLDVHMKTYQALRPEVLKIKNFMDFVDQAVNCVIYNINTLVKAEAKKAIHSDDIQQHLIQCIDVLALLDQLKDMKGCLQNDFFRYQRAFTPIRSQLQNGEQIAEEIQTIKMFLSNPQQPHNLIISRLKTDVQKIQTYDVAISLLLDHCADHIEEHMYLFPSHQHQLYRVIPFLIFLMDSDDKKLGINAFKSGKIRNLTRFQKLFKSLPIIPLYNDMQIDAVFVLRRCCHWEEDKMLSDWTTSKPQKLHQRYELIYHRQRIRAEYNRYSAEYVACIHEIESFNQQQKIITPKMLSRLFAIVLEGMQLLASWQAKINEQSAFKYARPVNEETYKKLGGKGEPGHEYEKVIKMNYTAEEIYALIDVVGMLKGLGSLMLQAEQTVQPLLRRHIHDQMQVFLQEELARPLRKAHKRKRQVKEVMLQMRDIGADWINPQEQQEDYLNKKEVLVELNRNFPRRATAPTFTQIALIRRMMHTIFDENAAGMKGGIFGQDKDLKPEWVPAWKTFYTHSYFYSYLLSYTSTIKSLIDCSSLWFREFFLEMTRCVQFPLSLSMPWIMTEFIIHTPSMKEKYFLSL